jgi:hypothetical protein
MKSGQGKNMRIRFDGKWAMNFFIVSVSVAVVIASGASFWLIMAGVALLWFLQEMRRGSFCQRMNKGMSKEVAELLEQAPPTPPATTMTHLSKQPLKRSKQKVNPSNSQKKPAELQPAELSASSEAASGLQRLPSSEEGWYTVEKTPAGLKRSKEKGSVSNSPRRSTEHVQPADLSTASSAGEASETDMSPGSEGSCYGEETQDPCAATGNDTTIATMSQAAKKKEDQQSLSASRRWFLNRKPPPSEPPPAVPTQQNATQSGQVRKDKEERTTAKSSATTFPHSGIEREIMKLEKKAREVKRLQQRQADGEELERNQLEKIAHGTEIENSIDKLRIQMAVAEHLAMLTNPSKPSASEQAFEVFDAPPGLSTFEDIAKEQLLDLEPAPLGAMNLMMPPPGLADEAAAAALPPPGLEQVLEDSAGETAAWADDWAEGDYVENMYNAWAAMAAYDPAAASAAYWAWAQSQPTGYYGALDASACWWQPGHAEAFTAYEAYGTC